MTPAAIYGGAVLPGDGDPVVGEWVHHKQTGQIGRVRFIARAGQPNHHPLGAFMLSGDVEVSTDQYGGAVVTNIRGFWHKWERLNAAGMASFVIAVAMEDA